MQFFMQLRLQWRCETSCGETSTCNTPCLQLISQLFGLTTNAQSKLVIHNAIFLATCLAVALRRQVVGRLQGVTFPVCNLSYKFFGLTTNTQSKLVLHDAIFLATCLAMALRRQVVGRLQGVTCAVCNLSYNFFGLTMNAQSKLVLHDAIFLATCLAMALRRQVVGRLQRVTCAVCNLSYNFFGLTTNAQSKLVLHDATFLATCLAMFEREIHCKLQKTCYTVQSRGATCNLFKTNSMQSLQKVELISTLCKCCKPKKVARQVAKRACYTLQPTCNFCRNAIETQVAKKIAPCNTSCRVRFCLACNDCRDF